MNCISSIQGRGAYPALTKDLVVDTLAQGREGLRKLRENQCTDSRSGHSPRESKVIIFQVKFRREARQSMIRDVVDGLHMERLLDFGVWCHEQVKENQNGDKEPDQIED